MTKILLFRPFCTNANEGQDFEQTFTKATFLDLSIAAADRLSICLSQLSKDHCRDLWFSASILMIKDVSRRAYLMFSEDREVNAKLTLIRERISCLDKQEQNLIGLYLVYGISESVFLFFPFFSFFFFVFFLFARWRCRKCQTSFLRNPPAHGGAKARRGGRCSGVCHVPVHFSGQGWACLWLGVGASCGAAPLLRPARAKKIDATQNIMTSSSFNKCIQIVFVYGLHHPML